MRVLNDDDVTGFGVARAVECMRDALERHGRGDLIAPARLTCDLGGQRQLVLTAGAETGSEGARGFRFYELNSAGLSQQLTLVLEGREGRLVGIVTGALLGALRTGAIGGVAIDALAARSASRLGLIGAGYQARTQLAAAAAVRELTDVRVYSRTPARRESFAAAMSAELGLQVRTVESAEQAARDAEIVVCSTTSQEPVLRREWLKPGAHISNVGPKFKGAHELETVIYQDAALLVTDAPAQAAIYGADFVLADTPDMDRLQALSQWIRSGAARGPDDLSVFVSLGLAGTEVLLAKALFAAAPLDS